jgi:hypothetical protein
MRDPRLATDVKPPRHGARRAVTWLWVVAAVAASSAQAQVVSPPGILPPTTQWLLSQGEATDSLRFVFPTEANRAEPASFQELPPIGQKAAVPITVRRPQLGLQSTVETEPNDIMN